MTRRGVMAAGMALLVAGCDNSVGSGGADVIDRRVQDSLSVMYQSYPETLDLASRSSGMLVMPLIGTAGVMMFGGAYGEGALMLNDVTVDYYSATVGSVGFQFGAKEGSQVLFFMTPEALADFRGSPGWEAGANAATVVGEMGGTLSTDTRAIEEDVISLVFNERGLHAGASLSGVKYARIVR
jgi:lipid-binding SYLF domain-containing protein